jgi:hypothetical protein
VVPYGFIKSRADTALGPEFYTERFMELQGVGKVRLMALESLRDDIVMQRAARHYR